MSKYNLDSKNTLFPSIDRSPLTTPAGNLSTTADSSTLSMLAYSSRPHVLREVDAADAKAILLYDERASTSDLQSEVTGPHESLAENKTRSNRPASVWSFLRFNPGCFMCSPCSCCKCCGRCSFSVAQHKSSSNPYLCVLK